MPPALDVTAPASGIEQVEPDTGISPARIASRSRDAEIAAAQFVETMECAGVALLPPVCLAALLLPFFWSGPNLFDILVALAVLCTVALTALMLCRAAAPQAGLPGRTRLGNRIAAGLALVFGTAWAVLFAKLYPTAGADERLVLVACLCGVIGDVGLMGSAWPVGLAYLAPVLVGGFAGLAAGQDAGSLTLAGLLVVAGGVVGSVLDRNRKRATRRIHDRLEAGDHAFTIDQLLLDFEESPNEWLWEIDARGRFRNAAQRMAEAAARSVSDLEGAPFKTILRTATPSGAIGDGTQAFLEAMKIREPIRNRVVAVDTPRGPIWWRLSAKPIHDAEGRFIGFRGIGTDITAARNADERIAYLANHDACTGLPNRVRFHDHAQRECAAAAKGARGGALLSLDLDGFKAVNDRLGHAAGDEVLKDVARRLTMLAPPNSMVARLGGDEFAIWCPTSIPARAIATATELIQALCVPFTLRDGAQIEIGASVGIALTPKHASEPDHLLMRADLALYRAKAEGKGQARVFIDDYERLIVDKRTFAADLRLALARQEFVLHFQPLVDVASGRIVCFETLIRWTSPTRGTVSPVDFIPAAEAAGLIVGIDRWVLKHACTEAATWPDDVSVAVNISPDHFRGPDLVKDVQIALRLSGLDPRRLEIEVTEGVFLGTSAAAVDTLSALRRLGIRIALDDFGTGYSSLSYLINFPIDKIKIDRAFVRDFTERHESRAIIDAILTLARKLSIEVVAEGVETSEQAMALKLRRCSQLQGFLLGRPQPGRNVAEMIARVPEAYREAVPTHVDTALGMALAMRSQSL